MLQMQGNAMLHVCAVRKPRNKPHLRDSPFVNVAWSNLGLNEMEQGLTPLTSGAQASEVVLPLEIVERIAHARKHASEPAMHRRRIDLVLIE